MGWVTAIGLMSGTSYDGIDAALVETDGEEVAHLGATGYRPYSAAEREQISQAMAAASDLTGHLHRGDSSVPKLLADVERAVTVMHAEAVESFLAANGISPERVGVVGFHGQTVVHRPDRRFSLQLGDGPALRARIGIPVVYNFRAADMAAGGQGAPVVPIFHRAMLRRLSRSHPVAVLNLGGVANVTFVDGEDILAFDTGPGNALIDDFVRLRTGRPHDDGGIAAGAGGVDEDAIAGILLHPFFSAPPPKSLDRNAFRSWASEQGRLAHKSVEDGAATLTALTAAAVAHSVKALPRAPKTWIAAGGGTRNPTLMRMLAQRLAPATFNAATEVGWSADALEAQAFGYLAVRALNGLPITFPTTTGVARPSTGGVLVR